MLIGLLYFPSFLLVWFALHGQGQLAASSSIAIAITPTPNFQMNEPKFLFRVTEDTKDQQP